MSIMSDTKAKRTRRSFTEDYKAGAVRLVLDEGKTGRQRGARSGVDGVVAPQLG
jgi:transposase-like protein